MDRALSLVKNQRALAVAGLQTQHRTPKGLERLNEEPDNYKKPFYNKVTGLWEFLYAPEQTCLEVFAPYQVGDRLYLQEPYQINLQNFDMVNGNYLDDEKWFSLTLTPKESAKLRNRKFPYRKTSGMYASLARHHFDVTGIRAEQLQDISKEDCIKEGLKPPKRNRNINITHWSESDASELTLQKDFMFLWNRIYGGGAWERNDWVWVIEFRKV